MYDNIIEDFDLTIGQFFGPNATKVAKIKENLKHLEERLDDVLDRPFKDDVHFACGNALENSIEALTDLISEMGYYERVFKAKARAWDRFPAEGEEDLDNSARIGYIKGFLDATK